ncbi:MAG: Y-family DNA polymerase [Gammaproteobacteria bacterium]
MGLLHPLPDFPHGRPPLQAVVLTGAAVADPSPQLWLALVFPALPLTALGVRADEPAPVAVLESAAPEAAACALSDGARCRGLACGMRAATLLALVPEVQLRCRQTAAESHSLRKLAAWCERFTPTIGLHAPQALLLEMRGSLPLFGGAERVQKQIHEELASLGCRVLAAFAPTPHAALWCARAGREAILDDTAQLHSALNAWPLSALAWPDTWQDACKRLGLKTLRDVLRLPRDGLARRFGPALLTELDQALGRAPDLVNTWTPPVEYTDSEDLGFDTRQAGCLLPVTQKLFERLAAWLRCRDSGIHSLSIELRGYHGAVERLHIGTRDITCNVGHWQRLVATHLEKLKLTGPVHTLCLQSGPIERCAPPSDDFFAAARGRQTLAQLLDILRIRLGTRAISGLRAVASYRPERASRAAPPGEATPPMPRGFPARPLWLLAPPEPLACTNHTPVLDGQRLDLEVGPERIECGGVLNGELRRDYYRARTASGVQLWIYRELDPGTRWFLHGYFA